MGKRYSTVREPEIDDVARQGRIGARNEFGPMATPQAAVEPRQAARNGFAGKDDQSCNHLGRYAFNHLLTM